MKRTTKSVKNQKGGYLGNVLAPLIKFGLPLMKNVLTPLAKTILKLLELTAVASATDRATQNKIYATGMTTLIISKKEMKDIMKKVKSLEESGLLINGVSEKIENGAK